jgi:alanyl-tRNA synthetase
MTEKLYYTNPYQFQFNANIIDRLDDGKRIGLILDKTCFYPEGGGQPADNGWLNGVFVYDVWLKGEIIIHYVEHNILDSLIKGRLDTKRRLDYMQQHTGQHIVSQALMKVGQYKTVSVHLGELYSTIEIDAPEIPESDLLKVEELANKIVNDNQMIKTFWVDSKQASSMKFRRPPPKLEKIRAVQIGEFDLTACGGTHLGQTGEVGLIKIIGYEKIRGHIRIQTKIGNRAYSDYHKKSYIIEELSRTLTCGHDDLLQRVEELQEQVKENKNKFFSSQKQLMHVLAELSKKSPDKLNEINFIHKEFTEINMRTVKEFIEQVLKLPDTIAIVFNYNDDKANWMVSHSLKDNVNLYELLEPLLPLIDGKGGGRDRLIQGGANNISGISEFVNQFRLKIEKELNLL